MVAIAPPTRLQPEIEKLRKELEASERRNRSRNIVIAVASVVAGAVAGQVLAALVG